MLGIDPELGASVLRLWAAAGSAVLLILFCVLALLAPGAGLVSRPIHRVGFVVAGAVLGGVMSWAVLDRAAWGERAAERRLLELRAQQLSAQALAPGSPLACLSAWGGESVETACAKALFGSPASVAAASAYVAAQLALLARATTYTQGGGGVDDDSVAALRRSLEADRYGFVAHVLALRDGCSGANCKALALFRDPSRVRANLDEHALDRFVDQYTALWGAPAEAAAAADVGATPATLPIPQPSHKPVNIDFPTAASIPAVSIMNPEPAGPVLPGVAAAAAANPNRASAAAGATAPRHGRKQASGSQGTMTNQSNPAVEPVWPEPMPATPPSSAAAPPAPPPAATAGQPAASSSSAGAGAPAHPQ